MIGAKGSQKYTVSFFGTIALIGAALLYLFSTTFDPPTVAHFFTMILILVIGIVLAVVLVGVRFIGFSLKSLVQDAVATIASFFSLYLVNRVIPAEIGISPLGETAFGILAGVAEEWFFRLFLCAWIFKVTKSPFLAIPASSLVWALFHLARYGGNMNLILIVFMAGLPLGIFTLYFRSADGPTFGHMIVNALARR